MATNIYYSPKNPVAGFDEQALERCIKMEKEFMPAEGYAQSKEAILRPTAVLVIQENSRCDNFNAFVPYLALTYFDRFISKNPLPNVLDSVQDEVVLIANCCLMLAAHGRTNTFRVVHFLAKPEMIKHGKHIYTVANVIINALKGDWDFELTAIPFVNMIIPRIPGAENIKRRVVNEIIIQAQGDITITEFRPSVIAAAGIMTACRFTLPEMERICYKWIVDTKFFNEVDLQACMFLQMFIAGRLSSFRTGKEPLQETLETKDTEVDPETQKPEKEPLQGISGTKDILKLMQKLKRSLEKSLQETTIQHRGV